MTDAQKHPPFPNGRIYTAVVIELCQWGWTLRDCPICKANSAVLRAEGRDAFFMCCPQCQRFTMTGPGSSMLKAWSGRPDEAELRDRLSRNVAGSPEPVFLDCDEIWGLANSKPQPE